MRKANILQPDFPYHVSARCINRDWFTIPMEQVWEIFGEQLWFIHHAFKVEILAFVLMHNHFHLIVRTPLSNLSIAMAWFMRETSRALTKAGNRENMTWGTRYFRSMMKSHHYYLNAYKYLYHNPVHAGVCNHVLDYPFSTLPGLLGQRKMLIPVQDDLTLFSDIEGTLEWINRRPSEDNWSALRKAIHRREFKISPVNNRPHPLEVDTL